MPHLFGMKFGSSSDMGLNCWALTIFDNDCLLWILCLVSPEALTFALTQNYMRNVLNKHFIFTLSHTSLTYHTLVLKPSPKNNRFKKTNTKNQISIIIMAFSSSHFPVQIGSGENMIMKPTTMPIPEDKLKVLPELILRISHCIIIVLNVIKLLC